MVLLVPVGMSAWLAFGSAFCTFHGASYVRNKDSTRYLCSDRSLHDDIAIEVYIVAVHECLLFEVVRTVNRAAH